MQELTIAEMTSLVGGQATIDGNTVSMEPALFTDFVIGVSSGLGSGSIIDRSTVSTEAASFDGFNGFEILYTLG
jgi:catalase (peroxidase I)